MQTITVQIDWLKIHAAAKKVDDARWSAGWHAKLGSIGCADVFGGSYRGSGDTGDLRELCDLRVAADTLAHQAWAAIHASSGKMVKAETENVPMITEWYSVCAERGEKKCVSHRGAAWRSTRFGGSIDERKRIDIPAMSARKSEVLEKTRMAVRVALAVHDLYLTLAETGIVCYDPANHICGVTDTLQVTGLRWLAGEVSECDYPSVASARKFAEGAQVAVFLEKN